MLADGILLAGDQSFVDLQFPAAHHRIGTDLISCHKFHDIIPHQNIGAELFQFPIPDGANMLGRHQGQLVYCPLGPDLLIAADNGIAQNHYQEGHILHRGAADQQHHRQNEEYQIEEGQAVFQNDLFFGFGGTLGLTVGPAAGTALVCLLRGQSHRRIRMDHRDLQAPDLLFLSLSDHKITSFEDADFNLPCC